ncbi:acylphosphatase [Salicibibacter halophilus]|nr:acylphosphatase [Salicibibacter halophilus]
MSNEHAWLSHLTNAVPKSAFGKRLSMYTIALEAWRRGIKVKFYRLEDPENKLRIRYSLSYRGKEYNFESSRGDLLTDQAYDICEDKDLTKQYLSKSDIPVPEGKRFMEDSSDEEIVDCAHKLGYPLVLKPVSENAGKGVMANIQGEDDLREALVHVRRELKYTDVLIEKRVPGEDFRLFVLDGLVGAVQRIPANIVGDGEHTVQELIDIKNSERKKNPHQSSRLIIIDKEVQHLIRLGGYTLNSVPKHGEQIYLREKASLSTGGEPIDVTGEISNEIKETAIQSVKAIPGLAECGVDIISDQSNKAGVVIEMNTRPGLGPHLFPVKGQARDIPKAFVDHYFPETMHVERTNLYFDFDNVIEPLKSRSMQQIELMSPPIGKLYAKRYIVSGDVQGVGYRKWIRKQALQHHLHGYTQNKKSGDVVVVVAGSNQDDVSVFKTLCYQGPDHAEVAKVKEKDYEKPVKMGFDIQKESKEKSLDKLKAKLQKEKADKEKMDQKITQLEHENNLAQQKLENVQQQKEQIEQIYTVLKNSRSWRYTQPLRNIGNITKRS